jgi:hypothetical protein
MAFSTLEKRLETAADTNKVAVMSGVKEGLLYCLISAGNYATMDALDTAVQGYLGKEHAANKWIQCIRKDGE